jgi:beta-phosphoglucomutase-like phosphatase (HAD superfamily)
MIQNQATTRGPIGNCAGVTLPPRSRINSANIRTDFPVITFLDSPEEKFVVSSRFRGIAADFDGTIMKFNFTEGLRQKAFLLAIDGLAIEKTGRPVCPHECGRIHRKAVEKPEEVMCGIIAEQLSALIGCPLSKEEVLSTWTHYSLVLRLLAPARYGRSPETAINDGIVAFLKEAQDLGRPVGVCTAGYHDFVMPLIKAGCLDQLLNFDTSVFVSLHPEISTKPEPDPYLLIARKMSINPWELLVLEDSATGALSALRAGAQVVLQPSGDREETLIKLARAIQIHQSSWINERTSRIVVLSEAAGFTQLVHDC